MKNTILIVDDYEFNRLVLCDMFPDMDIIEAENGFRAIEEYEKHKDDICCVLSDIMMPVLDGLEMLDYFFKNKYVYKVPIFIISADTSTKALTRAFNLGAEDIIAKPFNVNFTRKHILNAIELFRLREAVSKSDNMDWDDMDMTDEIYDN